MNPKGKWSGLKPYRQYKKELGLLSEAQFFKDIAVASGYIDIVTVRKVYQAMLYVLYREIRQKGAVQFPSLCDFYIHLNPSRKIRAWNMPQAIIKPPHHTLHMRPVKAVRTYFKQIDQQDPGALKDPMEIVEKEGWVKTPRYDRTPRGPDRDKSL